MIYLDNAATTRVSESVFDAMRHCLIEEYGNPGSLHSKGIHAKAAIEHARHKVALPIKAEPEKIIFTSGGSEANSLAICGLADYLLERGKTHIITSAVEHASVQKAIIALNNKGFSFTIIPVNKDGSLKMDELENAFNGNTGLVSVMAANNETGCEFPVREIGELCHKHNVLFHTDCVQGYANMDIDVNRDHIDFLSVSGHKFHAPKGVGFLYARDKTLLTPLIYGGDQEDSVRAGTENVASIVGMGVAAEEYWKNAIERQSHIAKLRVLFIAYLERYLQQGHSYCLNGESPDDSKIINLRFDGVDGETLLLGLSAAGVAVSAGSACHAHLATPSHVLTAMGLTAEEARSSIRISFSEYNTTEAVRRAAAEIANLVKILKGE